MRILTDATAVGEGGGGICTFLLGLLAGWRQAGFADEWHVVGMSDLPREVDALVPPPGTVHRGRHRSGPQRLLVQQLQLPLLARQRRLAPDVVLATTPVIPVVPVGIPVVATVHDLRFLSFPAEFPALTRLYRRVVYRHGLSQADAVVAVSEFTAGEVARLASRRPCPPRVVYHGADHVDRWPPVGPAQGHGITFAHWTNKRPDAVVQAWAVLCGREAGFAAPLHIVGARPPDAGRLRQLARRVGIGELVHVHPFLPDGAYQALFASASVVVLASSTEGFGLPVIEAQRLGIPVVARAAGGVPEAGGDAVLYLTDESPSSLARRCAEALFDPLRRDEVIRRGREHCRQFTWKATAEHTRQEMERCLAGRSWRRRCEVAGSSGGRA